MTHVSRIKLSKITEKKLVESLNNVFVSISDRSQMSSFLNALLTDTERLMLAKRLAIIILVAEGVSDSEIASKLHVTRITVSRMRYFYESRGKMGFDIALAKISGEQLLKEFKKFLFELGRYSAKAAGGRI